MTARKRALRRPSSIWLRGTRNNLGYVRTAYPRACVAWPLRRSEAELRHLTRGMRRNRATADPKRTQLRARQLKYSTLTPMYAAAEHWLHIAW